MCFSYLWFNVLVKDTRVDNPFKKRSSLDARYSSIGIDKSNNNSSEQVILDLNDKELSFIYWRVHVVKGKQSKRIQYIERGQGTYTILDTPPATSSDVDTINSNNTQRLQLLFDYHTGDTNLSLHMINLKVPYTQDVSLTVTPAGKVIRWDGLQLKYADHPDELYLQPNRPEDAQ